MTLLSTLSLVNCGLETLSEDIVKLTQLTQLTLDHNQLITLPATLGKILSLTSLSVNDNPRLSSLDVLSGSTSLITLRGSNCMINHLPTNISNLRTIEMNGNQLTSLDGIDTVASESNDSLSFGNNKITSISASFLAKIQGLFYFDLSDNLLTTLPDPIYQIKNLQTLNIRNNNFDEKESEWIQGLFRLTNTTIIM
jgi:Leucine-rich repeat (LRR) protein